MEVGRAARFGRDQFLEPKLRVDKVLLESHFSTKMMMMMLVT